MNNELMHNKDFIRCSAIVAELILKYKNLEQEKSVEGGELQEGSPPSFFV